MRDCCPANQFDSGCEGRECQSFRITKSNDMRGVFLPAHHIALAFVGLFALTAATFLIVNELRSMDRQAQIARRV